MPSQLIDPRAKNINFDSLTRNQAEKIWGELCAYYNMKTALKEDSKLMKTIGWYFQKKKIMSKKYFMESVTTTLGNTIYIPKKQWENRSPSNLVLLVFHEGFHRWRKVGLKYLWSKNYRAKEEAYAYVITNLLYFAVDQNLKQNLKKTFVDSCIFSQKTYQTSKYGEQYTKNYASTVFDLARRNSIAIFPEYFNRGVDIIATELGIK